MRKDVPATCDTNIAIYAASIGTKANIAEHVLASAQFISVQLLNEFTNVSLRKKKLASDKVEKDLTLIMKIVPEILPLMSQDSLHALLLQGRYQLSFYDALMLSVALRGGAKTFYSEDMQHGLVIEDRLTIINPFKESAAS